MCPKYRSLFRSRSTEYSSLLWSLHLSTVFCFDLWTKYSTLDFCAGVVLCTLLWCVFIGLTIWWTLNPAFCFPQAPLCGALTILFDPCFQDEGLIFATDFHPILARGRPVDPQSTPNMGQMRSGWGEMATPIRLASTIQPIHETVTNRSANSNSDEDVSNNQNVIERLTRAMKIRRGGRQRWLNNENSGEKHDKIIEMLKTRPIKIHWTGDMSTART